MAEYEGLWVKAGVIVALVAAILSAIVSVATVRYTASQDRTLIQDEALSAHQAALLQYQFDLQAISTADSDSNFDVLLDTARASAAQAAITYKVATAYLEGDENAVLRQCAGRMQDRLWNLTSLASKDDVSQRRAKDLLDYGGAGLGLVPDENVWETLDHMGTAVGNVRRGDGYQLEACP